MELLKAIISILKALIDWQVTTFLADARSAVIVIIVMNCLLAYVLMICGINRKPGKAEGLIVALAAFVIAYIAADAYVSTGGN